MAEKEYIDREALVERLKKEECDCEWLWTILDIPAADVAPVVRCKDCKCAQTNNFGVSSNIVLCCLETSKSVRQMDDFCSYGERKELDDGKIH